VAIGILLGRVNQPLGSQVGALPAALVAMLALMPLVYAIWRLTGIERVEGHGDQVGRIAALLLALLLGAFGLRSAILLSFDRAGTGTELLAREAPTGAVRPEVGNLMRLARDTGVLDGSVRDPTGSHALSVAIDERVQWPWRWYFRSFPEAAVLPAGDAASTGAEVVISPDADAVTAAGYAPRAVPNLVGVPDIYRHPDLAGVLRRVLLPPEWIDGVRFLLYREGAAPPLPSTVTVGLNADLAAKTSTTAPEQAAAGGPYSLADRPGPGAAEGQFDEPIGIAAAPDGTIYVVDSGNSRVERFDASGAFLGAWGANVGLNLARVGPGLGATGIAVGPDGRVYVADTWNHRVVALDATGAVQLELGGPISPAGGREATDNGDDPANVDLNPGAFFGPRGIAVAADAIYVTDTGNERVQVFTPDGAFVRAFGGYGSDPGQLIEPVGIALGPDGDIYVADSGNARIAAFTLEGAPVRQIPVGAWPAPDPTGARPAFQPYIAIGSDGTIYASASELGIITALAPDGMVRQTLQRAGSEQLDRPVGVAIGPDGDLLVTDIGANAVLRLPLLPPLPPLGAGSPVGAAGATPEAGTIPAPPEL
ncbi:MAG: NHL repeat-containing protein, partial [Thermomicrobiales bacterium]|nr:NHL repeat-containing protein [Thermomicrobiales bacterium]